MVISPFENFSMVDIAPIAFPGAPDGPEAEAAEETCGSALPVYDSGGTGLYGVIFLRVPLISTIVLFTNQLFCLGFRRFSRNKDPWKERIRYPLLERYRHLGLCNRIRHSWEAPPLARWTQCQRPEKGRRLPCVMFARLGRQKAVRLSFSFLWLFVKKNNYTTIFCLMSLSC